MTLSTSQISPAPTTPVIAIDGPAASGKGTLARRLAAALDFAYLDTGKIYRAVGYTLLQTSQPPYTVEQACDAVTHLDFSLLDMPALLSEKVAEVTSQIAAIPEVRTALLSAQRQYATSPPGGKKGAILDGRDIGSVVCPEAQAKFFIEARIEVRARRRFLELSSQNPDLKYEDVQADLMTRDHRDRTRANAPLQACPDAYQMDTSTLTADEAFTQALTIIKEKVPYL